MFQNPSFISLRWIFIGPVFLKFWIQIHVTSPDMILQLKPMVFLWAYPLLRKSFFQNPGPKLDGGFKNFLISTLGKWSILTFAHFSNGVEVNHQRLKSPQRGLPSRTKRRKQLMRTPPPWENLQAETMGGQNVGHRGVAKQRGWERSWASKIYSLSWLYINFWISGSQESSKEHEDVAEAFRWIDSWWWIWIWQWTHNHVIGRLKSILKY